MKLLWKCLLSPRLFKVYKHGFLDAMYEPQAWEKWGIELYLCSWYIKHPFSSCANAQLPLYQRAPIQVLAYIVTHTFGLRLIYPGSLGIIQKLLFTPMLQGRTQLVEIYNGQRSKIGTADGNFIDTMFVDNRSNTTKGSTLVICCEGNSGFYEMGIMTPAAKATYSVLGWNHPGFAGSTGLPYPEQEMNAMDAVMQYAINELGFQPANIVLFGWSIGGYTATWAAANYPVKALILDATFDDLLPLAENQMPVSWALLVKEVIRSYVNLNIAEIIVQYDGPVQLIRRTEDEIICLRPGQLSSNRGNYLLMELLKHRYPQVMEEHADYMFKLIALLEPQRNAFKRHSREDHEENLVTLISKYMRDYQTSHCTLLSELNFEAVMENIQTFK